MYYNRVGPDYFSTLGIAMVSGRAIDARDVAAAPRVVVINEAAARGLFGGAPALGRPLKPFDHELEVVGVARDAKYDSVRKDVVPTMFIPYRQPTPFSGGRAMQVLL